MAWCRLLLLASLAHVHGLVVLPDGRRMHILKDDDAVAHFIETRVRELAEAAISTKGAFSMSIGSGTTVTPLLGLKGKLDFSKVHLFFGNERTEGDAAGKCMDGASELVSVCGMTNVHPVPKVPPEEAAMRYGEMLRDSPREVVGACPRTGLPALDLVLLGSGADGHCASLYPDSSQVVRSGGPGRGGIGGGHACCYPPAEGKGGITLSLDAIMSARHVMLSAGKASQADMVRKCLGWSNASTNTNLPAGMISAHPGTTVEWLVTTASAIELPAL